MKQKLSSFIEKMNSLNIRVTICGPIPYRWMTNEAFSRALSLTKWISTQHRRSEMLFSWVDAFDLMWKHEYAFKGKRSKELSNYGNWLLEEAITDSVVLSD